jgi:ribosomal protein S18 acetylase RimI-like enzyme
MDSEPGADLRPGVADCNEHSATGRDSLSNRTHPVTDPATPPHPSLSVVRAPADRAEDAMSALLGAGPSAGVRFAAQARAAGISLDRIWCLADTFGRYRAAVLAVRSAGRTTMLLATHPRDAADAAAIGRVVAAACESASEDTDLAQALVEPSRPLDIAAYEAGGLARLATLDYLECPLGAAWKARRGTPEPAPTGWAFDPVDAAIDGDDPAALGDGLRAELCSVLERSYLDTLDCPGLAGVRRTGDVLDGHFGSGARERIWLVARERGAAGAVCLLNASADRGSAELVYLGVAREARGRGVARALLVEGMRRCADAGLRSVTLAVDARNAPARRLYDALGYTQTSSRVALIRALRVDARR